MFGVQDGASQLTNTYSFLLTPWGAVRLSVDGDTARGVISAIALGIITLLVLLWRRWRS